MLLQTVSAIAIITLSSFSAIPLVQAQSLTGSLHFTRTEANAFTGLIDTIHDFAYFATDTQPGIIVKVRLSDFTEVGSLVLKPGEDFLSAGVIDPVNGFAYFGSFGCCIEKVRLSDFTEVASIKPSVGLFTTAIIDTAHGFAYFGSLFGTIVKVNLSNFTVAGTLPLTNGFGLFGSAIDSNGFGYFSTEFAGGMIYQLRLSDFTIAKTLSVQQPLGATPLIDGSNTFSYWPTLTNPGSILKVRDADLSLNNTLTMDLGQADLNSGIIDTSENIAYFASGGGSSAFPETPVIFKVNLADFKVQSSLTLQPFESLLFLSAAAVIQTDAPGGAVAYFATYTSPSFVIKVKLSNMNRVATIEFQQGEQFFSSSVIDTGAGFVYFASNDVADSSGVGAITRIRTSNFTNAGTLLLPAGDGPICSSIIDTSNGFAYFGTGTYPAKIIKIRLSDFSLVGTITLNPNEAFPCTAVIDTAHGFAYFGTNTSPSNVVKIRLSDFTRVGAIQLQSPLEDLILSAVIDVNAGYAYFGTDQFPGVISKIRLSDFTEVGSLILNGGNFGEDELASAVIDPAGGFAYFGTLDSPAVVVKVRLSDFSENSSLTLNGQQSILRGAVIDTTDGFAYFGGQAPTALGISGIVVKVQLSTLTEVGSVQTPGTGFVFEQLEGASIDVTGGAAYFGSLTNPGTVYKISL